MAKDKKVSVEFNVKDLFESKNYPPAALLEVKPYVIRRLAVSMPGFGASNEKALKTEGEKVISALKKKVNTLLKGLGTKIATFQKEERGGSTTASTDADKFIRKANAEFSELGDDMRSELRKRLAGLSKISPSKLTTAALIFGAKEIKVAKGAFEKAVAGGGDSGMEADSIKMWKQAKSSAKYFGMVEKGPEPLKVIVQRKELKEAILRKAKTELKGKKYSLGTCYGEGMTMIIEFAGNEPGVKPEKLTKFISNAGGKRMKIEYRNVKELKKIAQDLGKEIDSRLKKLKPLADLLVGKGKLKKTEANKIFANVSKLRKQEKLEEAIDKLQALEDFLEKLAA